MPGKISESEYGFDSTVESDVEQTQCAVLRFSPSLSLALIQAGLASIGLDIHSGTYCERYKVINTGKFYLKDNEFTLNKVEGFALYSISGDHTEVVNDLRMLRCSANYKDIFSGLPTLNLTFDEPMRETITLYERINLFVSQREFEPTRYTDVRKEY